MEQSTSKITMCVPAEAAYARAVRMTAANLAVVCEMSVDEVEDVRMAAGEGFVYACATEPSACDITFVIGADGVSMEFALGMSAPAIAMGSDLDLMELLLSAVCDDFDVTEDGRLRLVKRTGGTHAK